MISAAPWWTKARALRPRRNSRPLCGCSPTTFRPTTTSGRCCSARAGPREAVPHLERAVTGSLHLAEANRYLGEALAKSGRVPEAIDRYQLAAKLDPSSVEAAFGLGNALAVQGRYQEAIPEFRRAVALAPDLIRVRNNLANALLFSGQVEAAIEEYRRALQLRPDDASVRDNLARALLYRRSPGVSAP